MKIITLPWQEPIALAQKIAHHYQGNWCFLYSGLHQELANSKSFIALFEKEKIITQDFFKVKNIIEKSQDKFFGYLSYESAVNFENLTFSNQEFIPQIPIYFSSYHLILEFCHQSKTLRCNVSAKQYIDFIHNLPDSKGGNQKTKVTEINSNFRDETYLETIKQIKEKIANGEFYQTNLTRKFYGKFQEALSQQDNFNLFHELTTLSPANYSSFLKIDDNYIISSSPELFLESSNNNIISQPIKGTSPRGQNPESDQKNKEYLKNSEKEKAENLMIVDLVRNDLSRICKINSIKVGKIFEITSYKNIHHMSSTISGHISPEFNCLDAVSSCFPPGSMTGAPKIKAIETAAQLENFKRGIYSGTIGIISHDYLNLSVVIRTLITNKDTFEFQVGGAITYNSDPKSELEEIYNKAKALFKLLKINNEKLFKKPSRHL
ncbi:MAG: anthranilate synthase component I family protein [Rickettsiales bacterium]|nr:anthranilate synthase component I family protein [Rickettsiales bacterium]